MRFRDSMTERYLRGLRNTCVVFYIPFSCADPDSFVRGGQTFTTFFVVVFFNLRGGRIQIPLLKVIISPPVKRHLNGVSLAY